MISAFQISSLARKICNYALQTFLLRLNNAENPLINAFDLIHQFRTNCKYLRKYLFKYLPAKWAYIKILGGVNFVF